MAGPELIFFLAIRGWVPLAIVHIVFAMGVFVDATRMNNEDGRMTKIVQGPMRAFATLVGGVFVAAAYWLIHHSTLSERG
ncbi:MAG: hypothetical protein ABJB34_08060 [Acidobacteriota bacterium]